MDEDDGNAGGGAAPAPADGGGLGEDGDEELEAAADEEEGHEDLATLKERWDNEAATVRILSREGVHETHPAFAAAVAARDAAEQAYRRGKTPHPIARRMGWAQGRLDKAVKAQSRTQAELAAFDAEFRARRQRILDRLEEDRARVARHREALDILQAEAGAEVANPPRAADEGREACGKAAGDLREAAPRAIALLESLPEGSPARGEASALVDKLAELQARLEEAARASGGAGPETFDIGDGEWSEGDDVGPEGGDGIGGRNAQGPTARAARWNADVHGKWKKGSAPRVGGKGLAACGAEGGPRGPTSGSNLAGTQAGTEVQSQGKGPPTPAKDQGDGGGNGGGGRTRQGDDGQPACKHLRAQGEAGASEPAAAARDAQRAAELYRQQAEGAAAGFGTPAGVQLAANQHTKHVAEVVQLAMEQGVQPVTAEGADLIMLGPEELRKWVQDNLANGGW